MHRSLSIWGWVCPCMCLCWTCAYVGEPFSRSCRMSQLIDNICVSPQAMSISVWERPPEIYQQNYKETTLEHYDLKLARVTLSDILSLTTWSWAFWCLLGILLNTVDPFLFWIIIFIYCDQQYAILFTLLKCVFYKVFFWHSFSQHLFFFQLVSWTWKAHLAKT